MADDVKLPALDPATTTVREGNSYPPPFDAEARDRIKRTLGDPVGLTQFGVNLTTLNPGAWSAQRHWHSHEDEFIYVLEGELTLVTDGGRQILTAGMAAGFPAGVADGHHLVNESDAPAVYLEVGSRSPADRVVYPDIDLLCEQHGGARYFTRRDGSRF